MARSSEQPPEKSATRHTVQVDDETYARLSEIAEATNISRIQVVEFLMTLQPKRQVIAAIKRAGIARRPTGRKKQSVFGRS